MEDSYADLPAIERVSWMTKRTKVRVEVAILLSVLFCYWFVVRCENKFEIL